MKNRSAQFILELDDKRYRLHRNQLLPVTTVSEVKGDKWIISDFEGAIPQVMTVDSPTKYVDSVLEKRLRDNGSLIGDGRVMVLRKHRRGSRATEAFFVAVPSALYASYAASAEDDPRQQLLFAFPMLLGRELERLHSKKPLVVIFIHDRHVDVVVGDTNRTYGAFRASWHRSGEDKSNLIENLVNGLRRIEHENSIKIKNIQCHFWMLASVRDADWTKGLAELMGIPMVQAKLHALQHDGNRYYSSIKRLLANLTVADSVSAVVQKNLYRAQNSMSWAAAALLGIVLVALGATFSWTQRSNQLLAESAIIQQSLLPPDPAPAVLKAAYEKPLALADTLGRAQISPSVQKVLAEISASVSGRVTFNEVIVEYPENDPMISLTLKGQSENTADSKGITDYNSFIAALRQRGFKMVDSQLKTDIDAFSFKVKLERGLN